MMPGSSGQDLAMRRAVPITATVVIILAVVGVTGCENDSDPASPVPTDSGPGGGDVGLDTSLPGLTDPQMTPAPNPNAGGGGGGGGGGAPAPTDATSP
jgi:hypothetical protein